MKRDLLKTVGILALVTLGLYAAVNAFLWLIIAYPIPYDSAPIAFDKASWEEASCADGFSRTRHRMLEDLKPQLIGKTKEDVVALLGQPDSYGQYCVGGEPVLFPLDTEWLEPVYGADGRVEKLEFYYN